MNYSCFSRHKIKQTISLSFVITLLVVCCFNIASAETSEAGESFHRYWPDNLFAVEFVNDKTGFIAGYSGTFLRTVDSGENWESYYIGQNELIRRLSFVDESNGWAVGHRGSIFHTTDGGMSWLVQKEVAGVYLRDVDFVDANNGWVVGHDANIWHTTDGGKSWQQQQLLGFLGRDVPRLHGVYAMDKDNAILVGEFGVIGHTENGGNTWLVTPNESNITYLSVAGNIDNIYAVGLDGAIIRLTVASDEQRLEINRRTAEKAAKVEAKAIAKAKRKKKKYVKKEKIALPVSDIEYFVSTVESGTKEHIFDISVASNGEAIAVGRSIVTKLSDDKATALQPKENFPLAFVWLGGVAISPDGSFWAPGIRGVVAKGNINERSFGQAFHLAVSKNIRLVTSRWGSEDE